MQDPTGDRSDGGDLGARLRTVAAWGDPDEVPDPADLRASTIDLVSLAAGRSVRRWVPLAAAAAAVAVVVGIIAVTAPGDDEIDVAGDDIEVADDSDFAAAAEASGVLTSPSADEVEQAMDRGLYKPDTGQTQVSAAGNYVSLRTCRFELDPPLESSAECPAGWAYTAGAVDGVEVHHGLLGAANQLELHVLDDRYFVATESAPDAGAPPSAWLIDAVSGDVGALTWSDTPTRLRSPEQALLVCDASYNRFCSGVRGPVTPEGGYTFVATDAGLPRVVDPRDGTIQPLAVPHDAESGLPIAQHGTGRIWVGTGGDGPLGLAYTDDGGETWTEVALPDEVQATSEELAMSLTYGDQLLEIAADGNRVAVTRSWGTTRARPTARGRLYLSEDAGRSWTTPNPSEPGALGDYQNGMHLNGAHLYVLADGRLVLMWSIDSYPQNLLASTRSDWAALEQVEAPEVTWNNLVLDDFFVNRVGVAFSYSISNPCTGGASCPVGDPDFDPARDIERDIILGFSTDLTSWRTIARLDD